MRGAAALLAAALLLAAGAGAEEPGGGPPPRAVRGVLEGRTTWSGTVLVEGDVEVPAGSSLLVEAGTRVVVAASDASRSGWNRDRVEIRIGGELLVAGTEERPVVIGPEGEPAPAERLDISAAEDRTTDVELLGRYGWHGIVLLPAEGTPPRREIRGALLFDAWAGLQVPAGRVLVEGSVFLSCGVGVEVGTAYADPDRYGVRPGVARPEIRGTRFAGCRTAVTAMFGGAPRLDRCVLAHGLGGAGNHRTTGKRYPLNEPGTTLSRCDVLFNGVGVVGPSLVTDSIFLRNRRALALSSFHAEHATGVDEYRVRGNVFASNGVILGGESLAGEAAVVDDPGYAGGAGLEQALCAPWPPLPDGLLLAAGGAARGKGSGGGDPGCRAEAARQGGPLPWTSGRPPLGRPLAVRPSEARLGDDRALGRARPQAGASFGGSWWCRAAVDGEGVLPLAGLRGGADGAGVLAWRVEASGAGKGVLEVNGDLTACDAWWNGDALEGIHLPRRFAREGEVLGVAVRRGGNVLVLRVRGRGAAPRLAVALRPPEGVGIEVEGAGPGGEARVLRSKVEERREGGRWARLSLSAPVSWLSEATAVAAGGGGPIPVRVEDRQVLLVGPLPEGADGDSLTLSGLLSPDGAPLTVR